MNTLRLFIYTVLVSCVVSFDITDQFYFPPNEFITQLDVHNNYVYALIQSSNPATVYKIDLDSMKLVNKLELPYFMDPSNPIIDKAENKLYFVTRNSSSNAITENLFTIDLNTFQVISIAYISGITSLGCNQLFKAGPKFYCINQDQSTCTIIRIDARTFTPEATKKQYCIAKTMYAWSSLITPDNQYAYIGTDPNPYIVILPNMTAQVLPYFNVQPYLNQKISRANGAMCATPDMTVFFMKGYAGSSFVRINVTSQIGSGKYYIEQGNSVTSCLVSPDSKFVFSGMADGSVRRADALSSSFGSGYVGLYNLDSAIQGMRMLDDQRTILVWTSHQMLKFDYNDQLKPISAQKLALQENFRKIVGMTVDREENFAYLYAYDASNYRNILTYIIKYDLQQRTIVQVANTTGSIPFSESAKIFLNAKQDRLVVFVGYAYVLNPIDLSVMYTNTNGYISDVDYFQDPTTSDIVFVTYNYKTPWDRVVSYNIDTNTTIECNVSRLPWQQYKHLIRGPNNQVLASTNDRHPTMALVDRTTCATKIINFTMPTMILKGEGAYYNGAYYFTAYDKSNQNYLLAYNLATGNFSQVTTMPYYGIMSSQLSFEARDNYVLLPPAYLDGYIWKLNLQTKQMEQLRLFAPPTASHYNDKTNTAYILSATEPPSIVKISV